MTLLTQSRRRCLLEMTAALCLAAMAFTAGKGQVLSGKNWCQGNMPSNSTYGFGTAMSSTFRSEVNSAAATWTGVSTCEFSTAYASKPGEPSSSVVGDGYNTVDYLAMSSGQGQGFTQCATIAASNELVECDSWFNSNYSWSLNPAATEYSMRWGALHEFGHWLRLEDSPNASDVMHVVTPGTQKLDLSSSDIAGCETKYPPGDAPWQSPPCIAGACCLIDGSCLYTDPYTCSSRGALFKQENLACGPGVCPAPTGACCLPPVGEGGCQDLTAVDCAGRGGTYKGDGTNCAATTCDPPPPPTGACCHADGGCSTTTAAICSGEGDIYKGSGTSCGGTICGGGGGAPQPPCSYEAGCGGLGEEEDPTYDDIEGGAPCPAEEGEKGLNASGTNDTENVIYGPQIGCANCYRGLGVALLKSFRSTAMLLTASGRRFVSLYYYHSFEIRNILRSDPTLKSLTGSRLNDFMPAIRWYLYKDVGGFDFVLDQSRITQIQEVVDGIKAHASSELRTNLDKFMVDVNAQRGKRMSDAIEGMFGLAVQ